MRKQLRTKIARDMEMLVAYQKNPSEEAVFGSNKMKEQHETMKLQNEKVMLS